MKTRYVTFSALFLALALLIPQLFHQIGYMQAGETLLPMHLPIFLSGLLLGPTYGGIVGAIAPVLSYLLTGMPPLPVTVVMSVELAVYGLVTGLCQKQVWSKQTYGIYLSMLLAMLAGRLAKMVAIFFALHLFGIQLGGVLTVLTATVAGVPGVILQFLLIPFIVIKLERSGAIHDYQKITD